MTRKNVKQIIGDIAWQYLRITDIDLDHMTEDPEDMYERAAIAQALAAAFAAGVQFAATQKAATQKAVTR